MEQGKTQKYGLFLKRLSDGELEELLSTVLAEMRRRDADHIKGDVMTNSKALGTLKDLT